MADGSLNFDTRIDTEGVKKGTNTLKSMLDRLINSISRMGNSIAGSFGGGSSKASELTRKIQQTEAEIENLRAKMNQLANTPVNNNQIIKLNDNLLSTRQNMAALIKQRGQLEGEMLPAGLAEKTSPDRRLAIYGMNHEWQKLTQQIQQADHAVFEYERELKKTKAQAATLDPTQGTEYKKLETRLASLVNKLKTYKEQLSGAQAVGNKTARSTDRMSKSMRSASKNTNRMSKSMDKAKKSNNGFLKSLKFSVRMLGMASVFRAYTAVLRGVKEGYQNLTKYSENFNKTASSLMSGLTRLKNSFATAFAPIVTVIEPSLKRFMDGLSAGVTMIGQFFAALSGQKTFTKAVDVQEDYAQSLEDSNKEANKLKGTLASFDKAEVLDFKEPESTGKADPSQMFEEIEIDPKVTNLAKKFLGVIEKIKQALGPTIEALNNLKIALEPLKQFAFTALYDFYNHFLVPVGKWALGSQGLPRLIDLIAATLYSINWKNLNSALAAFFDQLARAGIFTGDAIIDFYEFALMPIAIWTMGEGLPAFINAIANGLSTIDFDRIRDALIQLWQAIAPFAIKVGEGLLWFFTNVLVPLAAWTIGDLLPEFLMLLAAGIDTVSTVIDILKPLALWFFDGFLNPLAVWTGDAIISFLEWLVEKLEAFTDWAKENQPVIENITIAVLSFFAAWKFAEFIVGVLKFIGKIRDLISVFGGINWQLIAIVGVVGSIIYLAAQVAKAWDKMTPGEQLATKLIAVAGGLALIVAALAALTQNYLTLTIAGAIAAIAGLSIYGIASTANSRAPGNRSSYGYSSGYSAVSYAIPALATGAVIPPNAPFVAMLGDQKHGTNIEAPLGTIEQAVDNVLSRRGFGGGAQDINIKFSGSMSELVRLLKPEIDKENTRVGVSLVEGAV